MQTDTPSLTDLKSRTESADNDVETLATGAGLTLVGKVGGRGVDAIIDVLLARILGPSLFGLYAIGLTLIRIAGTIGMMGLQNGVIRFGTRYHRTSPADLKRTLLYSIGLSILAGSIIGLCLYLFAPWLSIEIYQKPELIQVFKGFAFGFPLAIGLWVASAATRISKDMKYTVISEDFGQSVSNLLLLIVFSFFGLTLWGAIVSNVISFGIGLGIALFFVSLLFSEALSSSSPASFSVKDLFIFSIPTGLAGTFTLLTGWLSRLFVGIFRTASEAGIYQSASQISLIFVIILNALNTIFAPMIADLFNRNELPRIEELYRVSTKWGLYIIAPIYLVLIILPGEFMTAVFGINYVSGAVPMMILASTQVVNIGTGAVGFILIMTGHQNNWFITSGFTMVSCLVLNLILVQKFGMVGAAVATAIAVSGLYIAGLAQVKLILGLWPYDRRYLKGVISLLAALGILLLVNSLFKFSPIIMVLISIVTSYIVFGLVLLIQGLDQEDREFVRIVKARVRNIRIAR